MFLRPRVVMPQRCVSTLSSMAPDNDWATTSSPRLGLVKSGIFGRFMRRRGTEEVVTGPTRNRITAQKAVRGFESHPLRHPFR